VRQEVVMFSICLRSKIEMIKASLKDGVVNVKLEIKSFPKEVNLLERISEGLCSPLQKSMLDLSLKCFWNSVFSSHCKFYSLWCRLIYFLVFFLIPAFWKHSTLYRTTQKMRGKLYSIKKYIEIIKITFG
jgi:hypothetical protein